MTAALAALIYSKRKYQDGISQDELAIILDVNQKTVSNWERGDDLPSPAKYPALARWLGMPQDELADLVRGERIALDIRVLDDGRSAARMLEAIDDSMQALRAEMDALIGRVERLEGEGRPPSRRAQRPSR